MKTPILARGLLNRISILAAPLALLSTINYPLSTAFAQSTAFTYQGRLADGANLARGNYDFQFSLYDAATNGTRVAGPVTNAMTGVSNGLFTALVDFGGEVFGGADRWLDIGARTNGSSAPFMLLTPRQLVTPTPVALAARFASNAATVTSVPANALPASVPQQDTNSQLYFSQGFESTNFPPGGFYVTQTPFRWYRETELHSEGIACAASGPISYYGAAACYLTFTNNFPCPSLLSFDWRVSSEAGHDLLEVLVDGAVMRTISGEVDWTTVTLPIAAGQHTVWWRYSRDVTGSAGADQGWVDNVRVVAVPGSLLTTQPLHVNGTADFAGNVGIGTIAPSQLLHLNVIQGHGEGMQIDSALAGHCPAICLNHTGTYGHKFRLASYGDSSSYGRFIIRDDTAGADRLTIDSSGTVYLLANASVSGTATATAFNTSSDRNLKENIQPLDAREVLEKVAVLPLSRWTFKDDSAVTHIGPMAQDFHTAFGVGTDDKHIATVDADGVALAAIQGLNAKLEAELKARDAELQALKATVAELQQAVRRLAPTTR